MHPGSDDPLKCYSSVIGFYLHVVVGPVVKIKTGFRALKPNEIRDFESVQIYDKKFYASVHELYYQ